jgi:cellulose synthase/poly-beta-1,6-N-acetylglucosamine synthase-like glycosyltransferase
MICVPVNAHDDVFGGIAGAAAPPRTYAAISPVRSEERNLRRIAEVMAAQSLAPTRWVIVDNGSTDGTPDVIADLEHRHGWVTATSIPGAERALPGSPVVRAFHAGLELLERPWPDVVVKLDVDTTFAADHFQRILEAFAAEPRLGITGGVCLEEQDGVWRPTHVTSDHVRGAVRAYRRECLLEVLPLEDGMGWDGIDELKAQSRGWSTRVLTDLTFRHHRPVGARDGSGWRRLAEGRGAHYMGYRASYLVVRSLYQSRRDPRALAMIVGYVESAVRRRPVLDDPRAVRHLREKQRLRSLRARAREARGRA